MTDVEKVVNDHSEQAQNETEVVILRAKLRQSEARVMTLVAESRRRRVIIEKCEAAAREADLQERVGFFWTTGVSVLAQVVFCAAMVLRDLDPLPSAAVIWLLALPPVYMFGRMLRARKTRKQVNL